MRKKYVVGNWKMFKTSETALNYFSDLQNKLRDSTTVLPDIGICSPAVFLQELSPLKRSVHLYAQNVHWEPEGAFTGEISTQMLLGCNITGSLVAHSERRQYFNETNLSAGKKLNALLSQNLQAIYCVGESLQERESGEFNNIIETQLKDAFIQCSQEVKNHIQTSAKEHNSTQISVHPQPLSIAYEPVWAIGTGKAATVKDAHDVHQFIRKVLSEIFDHETANSIRILYGGSVKASNAVEYLSDDKIDGALIGGASLNPDDFFKICCLTNL